ncbi:MAG: MgtC/SapB family protein [Bacteroidales bacterium]|nr:MgtC/SapB family protein [Bacteroidales bacterium]
MLGSHEILIRLILASFFGGLIGLERERKDWAAGLRTHMMVSVGACLTMIVSSFGFADILGTEHVVLDPSRVAAQVVSGIGFIGAGTILFMKDGAVRGLTTAAGLWTVAAIGLATGGGLYFAACSTTIIALIILWALQPLERFYAQRFKHKILRITTTPQFSNDGFFQEILNNPSLKMHSFTLDRADDELVFQIKLESPAHERLNELIQLLKNNPEVKEIIWAQ